MESIFFSGAMIFMLIGVFVGILLPVLGSAGSLMIMPLIMLITGLPPEMAIPISLAHLAALSVPGVVGQWQSGNVDLKMLLWLMVGVIPGIIFGDWVNEFARRWHWFTYLVLAPYLILLVCAVIYRFHPFSVLPKPNNRYRKKVVKFMKGLPGKTRFITSDISLSRGIPIVLGLALGLVGKIFGPMVALLLSPILIVCLDIPVMCAVATAMAANFIGMLTITSTGQFMMAPLTLQILLWLFLGTSATILGLSVFLQKSKPYPAPVAVVLVLITSVTLWALVTSQPNLGSVIQNFSLPVHLLGWFGGVQG